MKKLIIVLMVLFWCSNVWANAFTWDSGYKSDAPDASDITTNTSNFGGTLSSAENTVQKALDILDDNSGNTNLTDFTSQTAWRVFYSDGSGDVTELALGASGTVLKSNGVSSAPSFQTDSTGSGSLGTNLSSSTDDITSDNGTIRLATSGGTNNEDLDFDFETTANTVAISSSTGVTLVDFGTIDLATDALDLSEGNITNVGDIALDTISSDAGTTVSVTLGTDAGDDFIVGNNNALVVEGDNDRVGIGEGTPLAPLHITNDQAALTESRLDNSNASGSMAYMLYDGSNKRGQLHYDTASALLTLGTDIATGQFRINTGSDAEAFRIDASGNITTGVWNGTDIAVADGGTGASTAGDARTNLGAQGTVTWGAGLAATGDTANTDSSEADFLKSGALTCGASTQGKAQVHTTPLQYCDNAGTPALQYAAYGASDGDALAGDSITSFFPTFTKANLETELSDVDDIAEADGDTYTGTHDFGGAVIELTNSATPTTDATGEIALDTTITDHQPLWQYFDGGENMTIIAIDTSELPALDNEIIKYNAATDKFGLEADAGGGGTAFNEVILPVQSAKITGSFVTDGDATQGAQIDAGDGNWRLLFDATTDEAAVWGFKMPNNYSSDPILEIIYSMTSATSGTVELEGAIMCVSDGDAVDLGTASFSTIAVGSVTVPGTAGQPDKINITLNDDSCAADDYVYVYLSTDADDGTNDTATGDREVTDVSLSYTAS